MIIEGYGSNKVEKICNDESYARQFFLPADADSLKVLLVRINATKHMNDFFKPPLKGKYQAETIRKKDREIVSLRLSYHNRMEIVVLVRNTDGHDKIKILEVKGHYGGKRKR